MVFFIGLPVTILVVGIFFGMANGARAAFTWLLWMTANLSAVAIAYHLEAYLVTVLIGTFGTVASFWVAVIGGHAQRTVNQNAPAQTILRTYDHLSANEKAAVGRLTKGLLRVGSAHAADRLRDSHPHTSAAFERLSRE